MIQTNTPCAPYWNSVWEIRIVPHLFDVLFARQCIVDNGILLRNAGLDNPAVYVNGTIIGRTSSTWWAPKTWNYFALTRNGTTIEPASLCKQGFNIEAVCNSLPPPH